jgi:hypothetical protein
VIQTAGNDERGDGGENDAHEISWRPLQPH